MLRFLKMDKKINFICNGIFFLQIYQYLNVTSVNVINCIIKARNWLWPPTYTAQDTVRALLWLGTKCVWYAAPYL